MFIDPDKKRTAPRYFNRLCDHGDYFIKSSIDEEKINAEIQFYTLLPENLKNFFPSFLGHSKNGFFKYGYSIEKINNSDVSIFFLDSSTPEKYFEILLDKIDNFLLEVPKKIVTQGEYLEALNTQFITKHEIRLKMLKRNPLWENINRLYTEHGFESIDDFVEKLNENILSSLSKNKNLNLWFSHGDLCLSNMIIHNESLFLVDPRGILKTIDDNYLLPHYDLAKLTQCFYGHYDFINNNLPLPKTRNQKVLNQLNSMFVKYGVELSDIRLIESSHFFSMLPLHIDSEFKMIEFVKQSILSFNEGGA